MTGFTNMGDTLTKMTQSEPQTFDVAGMSKMMTLSPVTILFMSRPFPTSYTLVL